MLLVRANERDGYVGCFVGRQDKDGHTASHVLVLGGAPARFPSNNIVTTRNPFLSTYLLVRGVYHLTVYHLHDRRVHRRCLQYLIHYGADLGIRSVERETARDIAVRMRKMALLEVIEDACMLLLCPKSLNYNTVSMTVNVHHNWVLYSGK